MTRPVARLCTALAAALVLAGCHYTEAEKWSVCCALYIAPAQSLDLPSSGTVLVWQRRTSFSSNGRAVEVLASGTSRKTWKDEQVEESIAAYRADNPSTRAADYLVGLGMTCTGAPGPRLSGNAVLGTWTRIDPVEGGKLCHR